MCNSVTIEIWNWAIFQNIWIRAEHLPGSENYLTEHSRELMTIRSGHWMIICLIGSYLILECHTQIFLPIGKIQNAERVLETRS